MRVTPICRQCVFFLVAAACSKETPEAGTERGPCWGGQFCPEPLVCASGYCVLPPGLEDVADTDATSGGDAVDATCSDSCALRQTTLAICDGEAVGVDWYTDVCMVECWTDPLGHLAASCETVCPGVCSEACAELGYAACDHGGTTYDDGGTTYDDGGTTYDDGGTTYDDGGTTYDGGGTT